MMHRVVLLTGTNLGDKALHIRRAADRIGDEVGHVVLSSRVYESEPWGFDSTDAFLNQVLVVETELSPLAVLDCIQQIETSMGRIRTESRSSVGGETKNYESRTMDIDILFYDDSVIGSDRLTVPHPLICEREFVLTPLREILGDFIHPVIQKKISEL